MYKPEIKIHFPNSVCSRWKLEQKTATTTNKEKEPLPLRITIFTYNRSHLQASGEEIERGNVCTFQSLSTNRWMDNRLRELSRKYNSHTYAQMLHESWMHQKCVAAEVYFKEMSKRQTRARENKRASRMQTILNWCPSQNNWHIG